jgi:hypothetical protein
MPRGPTSGQERIETMAKATAQKPPTSPRAAAAPPARPSAPAASAAPAASEPRSLRARLKDVPDTLPVIATKVYCNVISSGPRASLLAMPLHEIPLARRKLEILREGLKIDPSWPEGMDRHRGMTAPDLASEYERLRRTYVFADGDDEQRKFDLVSDLYGRPHEGRLVAIIRRMHAAYEKLRVEHRDDEDGEPWPEAEWESIVRLAAPEQDFVDHQA